MVVGKPDFDLNSFGIQYKEKKVNYTTKRIGMNSQVTTDEENEKEHAQWSKMDTQQSNTSKKRGEKPNARQAVGTAPTPSPEVIKKPRIGRQNTKETPQSATSSPPSPAPKESTNVTVDVPNTKEEMVTREGGSTHSDIKPRVPKTRISGRANQEASVKLSEDKANPVLPKNAANDIILDMNILKLDLIKTTGKNQGDVSKPVTEGDNREVFTNMEGNNAHQNPPPVGGGGFAGKGRRRIVNGEKKIVAQTTEETVPKVNDVPTSKLGDVVDAKDVTPKKVTNAQKLITENPTTVDGKGTIDSAISSGNSGEVSTWNGGLKGEKGGSDLGGKTSETAAPESDKEDKEDKFINEDTSKWLNSPAGKRSTAARKKREAAILARGGTVNRAISEINAMTDGMKELMKDDEDKKDFAIRERNYEALGAGGGKPDNSLLLDVDKPAVKKIKKDAEETIFKATSLKLDLMKDSLDGTGKNTPEFGRTGHMGMNYQPQHKEGQAVEARIARQDKRELPYEQRSRMNVFDKKPKGKPPVKKPYKNNQPDSRIPENKLTEKERNRIITTGLGDASDPNDKNPYIGGHGAPSDLKEKAEETIFKATSLKLDLTTLK